MLKGRKKKHIINSSSTYKYVRTTKVADKKDNHRDRMDEYAVQ